MGTRIGLGLDFSKNVNEVSDEENLKQSKHSTLDLGSASMLFPTNRNDDITSFIEKATDIKLSNIAYEMEGISPQIQSPKFMTKKKTVNISEDSETHDEDNNKAAFKCGICKSTTLSNLGCVTCRRTQLMNNMSSKSPETLSEVMSNPMNSKRKLHKVHTDMLPRYPIGKLNTFNRLTDGDKIFANELVSHPWTPTAILPHRKKEFPKPKSIASQDEDSESDSSSYSDDDDGSTSDSVPSQSSRRNSIESLSVEASRSHTSENGPSNGKDSINAPRRFTRNSYNRTNSDFSDMSNTNRQAMAVEHKEEAAELSRRCLHTAICCILFGLLRRDPLRLFFDPVSDDVEDYHQIITSPIDFRTIRDKVVKGQYQSLGSFVTDVTQLCHNALCYNPPGSVYYDTAIDLKEALKSMQKRASDWMYAIKNAHSSYFSNLCTSKTLTKDYDNGDPFQDLRSSWPGAVEMLDDLEWYKSQVSTDFIRTKENENAYYSTLAVKRAARAADALLCKMTQNEPYIEPISFRDHDDDENLRKYINEEVSKVSGPLQLHRHSTSREIQLLDLLKKIRKRRVDRVTTSHSGCARCDGLRNEVEARISRSREAARKFSDPKDSRIAESRLSLSTGLASKRLRESQSEHYEDSFSIRGSTIQGWGLFSERVFKKGEVVAEYVGEYVTNANADAREQLYEESRIQDYQFRVSNDLVIDATKFGGFARYINHSCDPNCISKVIQGDPPNERMKRVVIISQRDIQVAEEITYDYQFPLELDPESRIICNCSSKNCRGFMNWDSQETTKKDTTNLSMKDDGSKKKSFRKIDLENSKNKKQK
jgi:histone-lysine N-methyltransferase SETD1